MINVKDHKARYLFNPFEHLGPKRLALLESSWAHLFREEILHQLPVQKLFPVYSEFKGRKTKELYAIHGITLLQQMEDLTDEDTVRQFAFNIIWQYPLDITDASDVISRVHHAWVPTQHLSRIGHAQKLITKTIDRFIHSMYIIYAHEGSHICNGIFDHIIDQRSESEPSSRIELTPPDWLMKDRTESVG